MAFTWEIKPPKRNQAMVLIRSVENPNMLYMETPNGDLRLIFEDGEYVGWYLP